MGSVHLRTHSPVADVPAGHFSPSATPFSQTSETRLANSIFKRSMKG
jgi:hypothetical protein